MKILVTGGAGFIGSDFVRYTVEKYTDDIVLNLDKLTYAGNLDNLESVKNKSNYRFIRGDISDRNFIYTLFNKERFDIVINFAAESHVDRSIKYPDIFINSNYVGTQVLLDACLKYNVPRYHQVSTDEVYGDLPLNRPDLKFTEDNPLKASSPYSASKAGADLLVQAYSRTFGLNVSISRCSNNYGPYQFPEKLIPVVITKALNNVSIPVYGQGENVRDWLFVRDHNIAIDKIIRAKKHADIYNIGGNHELSNLNLVKAILFTLNKPESLIEFVEDRAGHDLRYAIDSSKISTELNWQPQYSFEQGIQHTINWYINNQTWLKRVETGEYQKNI